MNPSALAYSTNTAPSVIHANFGNSSYFEATLRELHTLKYRYTHERQLYGSWFRKRLKIRDYHIDFKLVSVGNLTDDPECRHSYHNIRIFKGQTYYEHIHDHVFGSEEVGRERKSSFEEFESVADFICHAHNILKIVDLDRFMDFKRGRLYLRFDFKDNVLYIVSKCHLLTAYKPQDMTHNMFKMFVKSYKV